jgi:hypothetical protein
MVYLLTMMLNVSTVVVPVKIARIARELMNKNY